MGNSRWGVCAPSGDSPLRSVHSPVGNPHCGVYTSPSGTLHFSSLDVCFTWAQHRDIASPIVRACRRVPQRWKPAFAQINCIRRQWRTLPNQGHSPMSPTLPEFKNLLTVLVKVQGI